MIEQGAKGQRGAGAKGRMGGSASPLFMSATNRISRSCLRPCGPAPLRAFALTHDRYGALKT